MAERATPRLGNAPVSYGVFGDLDVDAATTPRRLLETMSAAGYTGSELGPPGFFGDLDELVSGFADTGMTGIGTYVPLHTQDRGALLERDLERMRLSVREVAAVNPHGLVILADEGSEELLAHPCHDAAHGLDQEGWDRLGEVVEAAARDVRDAGLVVSFHPHVATYVENPTEIERLLERTGLELTYDVAHVVMGGGHAVEHFRRWRDRINHVHVKDVRMEVLRQAVDSGRTDLDTWWEGLCTRLGDGDLELAAFVDELVATGWTDWVVVEQDRAPLTPQNLEQVLADQAHNHRWLRDRIAG